MNGQTVPKNKILSSKENATTTTIITCLLLRIDQRVACVNSAVEQSFAYCQGLF